MDIHVAQDDSKTSGAAADSGQDLLEVRQKIYPRAVTGVFRNWRVALIVFTQLLYYGLPWLQWDGRQALLFDLAARKFYIFGLVIWPQDFIFLTGLLIISAYSLFLFTAIAGRFWCGYACPQTVYTEMFLWIERKIEGDRSAQIKLDKGGWTGGKLAKKSAKHAVWLALSLWTGFTFVGYFTPIHTLLAEFASWTLGPWETFWIFFYGFATYGNAGFMREQVCKYMCPYARFQSVMFDADTLIVSYDPGMGEPRGSRSRALDYKAAGLGTCVDCGICVQVCPTGIDIRNGLQYECIGCAACVDGCDKVMDKMGYPKGLIRYTTENVLKGKYPDAQRWGHVFRPRTIIYTTILLAIVGMWATGLFLRVPLRVDVLRDRLALARETDEGMVENVYQLHINNMENRAHSYRITAEGLPSLKLTIDSPTVTARALETISVFVRLQTDPANLKSRSAPIEFKVEAEDDSKLVREAKSSFFSR